MRRLILPLFLVLSSSGCGGCVGDDSSGSSGQNQRPIERPNPGVIRPGALHMPLRPFLPQGTPSGSAAPPASSAPGTPSAAPSGAPSGSAVP